jgi:trans-aconitate 2-methyltransferase
MDAWSSKQYLLYEAERTQPAFDLAAKIPLKDPAEIADIGCGPGNSTAVLARRFPNAHITGIDSSEDMVAQAKTSCPALDFMVLDASCGLYALGSGFDVVFSNACIQWVPDHRRLIPEMLGLLKKGGVLAVQTPMNYKEPIHRLIGEVTFSPGWSPYFHTPRIFHNLEQGEYFDLLSDHASDFILWETVYMHRLKSHGDVLEWYRGTGLRPYLNALPGEKREDFEREIYERIAAEYPLQKNGEVLFRFPRFFFIAVK